MESGSDNSSRVDLRTVPATNSGELHQTSPVTEKGHGSTFNSHLEARPANPFGEVQPHPSALGSSSSQNPFLLPTDATNNPHSGATVSEKVHDLHQPFSVMQQGNGGMNHNSNSSLASAYESSPGNPFNEPTYTSSKAPFGTFESSQTQNQPSAHETVPSHHTSPALEQGHHQNMEPIYNSVNDTSNSQTDTNAAPKVIMMSSDSSGDDDDDVPTPKMGYDKKIASESSDDDVSTPKMGLEPQRSSESSDDDDPIRSIPKHGQSGDMFSPGSNWEFGTNNGSEIQNPPVQVMERPGDSVTTTPSYHFPSHVFARDKSNSPVEWSTCSNESLFSIYMGNMSFSSDLAYLGKSNEWDKPGDINLSDTPIASPSNQSPPPPVNKFNDISQRTAELHDEGAKATEAKAAETMREVIMENSRTTENTSKGNLSSTQEHGAPHALQSDSTKSFAFQSLTDKDRSGSSKGAEEKQKQREDSKKQETPKAAQTDNNNNTTTNASSNGWLSCFACCPFCH